MKRFQKVVVIAMALLLSLKASTVEAADYTVTSNDSLSSLSKLFNTSVSTLQATNNFKVNSLSKGDVIFVPAHVHKVKSGESLFKIAGKYGIPLSSLKRANYRTGTSIVPGEKLLIPGVSPYRIADAVISYSSSELDLLARLIEAEAAGESLQAKIAVGAVVINRVQSGDWAPTITKVIYQKFDSYYQFTPVKNGMIKNTPSAESKRAARLAIFGSDPSRGAIFYFDQTCKNSWLWAKPQTARIDHMVFAK
ncbi:MAG TPA: LysM peptidoglycan-binding domain-containing protein [Clostridiales bacterium]|nr:LysM peptidoglycan-binding domain-containing protein [Clostridiales bacterium]